MRAKPLKTRDLILSLSKDEAKISCFFAACYFSKEKIRFQSSFMLMICHPSFFASS